MTTRRNFISALAGLPIVGLALHTTEASEAAPSRLLSHWKKVPFNPERPYLVEQWVRERGGKQLATQVSPAADLDANLNVLRRGWGWWVQMAVEGDPEEQAGEPYAKRGHRRVTPQLSVDMGQPDVSGGHCYATREEAQDVADACLRGIGWDLETGKPSGYGNGINCALSFSDEFTSRQHRTSDIGLTHPETPLWERKCSVCGCALSATCWINPNWVLANRTHCGLGTDWKYAGVRSSDLV